MAPPSAQPTDNANSNTKSPRKNGGSTTDDKTSLTAPPISKDLTGKLRWYYSRLFPIVPFTRWLRYDSDKTLSHREISFTLPGDIYVRYRSFTSTEAFHEALKTSSPSKIDIGAIYNFPPSNRHIVAGTLTPLQKELVFDIDMTDYADVLGKMGGGSAVDECDRSWKLMVNAVNVIHDALTMDFGFKHILWVYSGRRGVHCWVCDEKARKLTNEQRCSIADFLYIRFENKEQVQNQSIKRFHDLTIPLHPSILRAKTHCEKVFHDFSIDQAGILSSQEGIENICAFIPNKKIAFESADKLLRSRQSKDSHAGAGNEDDHHTWQRLEKDLQRLGKHDWNVRGVTDYIILRHTYPRLDANVSKEINHLLKAPFSVHPKTERVCVPFDPKYVDSFDPKTDAPIVSQLLNEMGQKNNDGEKLATMKMEQAVQVFEQFVRGVEEEAARGKRRNRLDDVDTKAAMELLAH